MKENHLVMGSYWWIAGAIFSAVCTAIGAVGNGLTIAIFIKFQQFRNAIGFCVLKLVSFVFFKRKRLII